MNLLQKEDRRSKVSILRRRRIVRGREEKAKSKGTKGCFIRSSENGLIDNEENVEEDLILGESNKVTMEEGDGDSIRSSQTIKYIQLHKGVERRKMIM